MTLKDNWPAALVLVAALVCFTLTAIFAPPDVRTLLFGVEGFLTTALGIWLRSPRENARLRRERESSRPPPPPAPSPPGS